MTPPSPEPKSDRQRRRSQRVMLSLAVTVTGESAEGSFTEDTKTVVVNAHGALITLAARVSQNQIIRIRRPSHSKEISCRVSYVGPVMSGKTQFGIEFAEPAAQFWDITFPPDDWMPVG